jgi:pimeloyl-ACP methyl ester carboxylesterase
MTRPRLLLIPSAGELEWAIRPRLEVWAEVLAFDPPGVGDEAPPATYDGAAVAELAGAKLEQHGWDSCVVVADEFASATAVLFASRRPHAIDGLALGHAALNFRSDTEPPAINAEVRAAFHQTTLLDDRTFMRHLTQITQGQIGDELAEAVLARVPSGVAQAYLRASLAEPGDWIEGALRELDKPLLLAEHDPCLLFTKEGYEAAVAAFPDAMRVTCRDKPNVSDEFARALHEFCDVLAG